MRRILIALTLLVPFAAFALDYSDRSEDYFDAPFKTSEAAGISLLTNLGVVEGYPDGRFRPNRNLNRAEFLKIAYLSAPEKSIGQPNHKCFPDVQLDAWFSMYVCQAKEDAVVQGYPDGFFHPERNVNYAEGVKILVELYGYSVLMPFYEEGAVPQWFDPYFYEAEHKNVLLTQDVSPGEFLTRSQMARLAAPLPPTP